MISSPHNQTKRFDGPLFICGPSRSGTALMRSILNQHEVVHLSAETHYFDDLRPRLGSMSHAELDEASRRRCEDFFLALGHRPYGHKGDPEKSRISRADLQNAAKARGDGGDAYFEAFCRLNAQANGARIWGEKTPRHAFRITEMLERFPEAKVVCMVRDPRAVIASYRDWKYQGGIKGDDDPEHQKVMQDLHRRASRSYDVLLMSLLWRSTVTAACNAARSFGAERVRLMRYEDLVTRPKETVESLAAWIDLEFASAMLDVPMHNSSFSRFELGAGISKDACERWRSKLSDGEVAVIQSTCRRLMAGFDYEGLPVRAPRIRVVAKWLTLPVVAARATLANRSRIGNLPAYVWRRLRLALSSSATHPVSQP